MVSGRSSGESEFLPMLRSNEGNPLSPWCQTMAPESSNKTLLPHPTLEILLKAKGGGRNFHCLPALMRSPSPSVVSKEDEWGTGLLSHLEVMSVISPSLAKVVSEEAS